MGEGYFRVVHPARSTRTNDPTLVRFRASAGLLRELGLPLEISAEDLLACFGTWEARPMARLSMAYMGWQFGVLNLGLGDGRAFTWTGGSGSDNREGVRFPICFSFSFDCVATDAVPFGALMKGTGRLGRKGAGRRRSRGDTTVC